MEMAAVTLPRLPDVLPDVPLNPNLLEANASAGLGLLVWLYDRPRKTSQPGKQSEPNDDKDATVSLISASGAGRTGLSGREQIEANAQNCRANATKSANPAAEREDLGPCEKQVSSTTTK